jgi:hypothetical protein
MLLASSNEVGGVISSIVAGVFLPHKLERMNIAVGSQPRGRLESDLVFLMRFRKDKDMPMAHVADKEP